jgi:hypothetical protein
MSSISSGVLPACWAEILDNVEKALDQAEAEALRSAQALEAALASATMRSDVGEHPGLAQLEEQQHRLAVGAAAADQVVAQVEATLAESEAALRRWLAEVAAIRRKLAKDDANSV